MKDVNVRGLTINSSTNEVELLAYLVSSSKMQQFLRACSENSNKTRFEIVLRNFDCFAVIPSKVKIMSSFTWTNSVGISIISSTTGIGFVLVFLYLAQKSFLLNQCLCHDRIVSYNIHPNYCLHVGNRGMLYCMI